MVKRVAYRTIAINGNTVFFQGGILIGDKIANSIVICCRSNIGCITRYALAFINILSRNNLANILYRKRRPAVFRRRPMLYPPPRKLLLFNELL